MKLFKIEKIKIDRDNYKMRALYILSAILLSLALLLSSFEITLFLFHSPINSDIIEPKAHTITWRYLLEQKYMAFIDLDSFTLYEKRHLLDVKRLFDKLFSIWILLSSVVLSTIIFFYFIDRRGFSLIFRYNFFIGLSLILFFAFIMSNFLDNFSFFHQLIFSENSWIFPDNSLLIEWFPIIYFQEFIVIMLSIYLMSLFAYNKYQPNLSTLR
jgi:uncharacterized membrane protein